MNNRINYSLEECIKNYELDLLNENDQKIVVNMLKAPNISDYKFDSRPFLSNSTDIATQFAIYTQNYLILKQLTQINESNKNIVEQNEKIIELLSMINQK